MQRVIYQGMPVWRNADKELFAYDTLTTENPIKIGTESAGFMESWKDLLDTRLKAYRESLQPRSRLTAPSKK
jgi:hypothetical protein